MSRLATCLALCAASIAVSAATAREIPQPRDAGRTAPWVDRNRPEPEGGRIAPWAERSGNEPDSGRTAPWVERSAPEPRGEHPSPEESAERVPLGSRTDGRRHPADSTARRLPDRTAPDPWAGASEPEGPPVSRIVPEVGRETNPSDPLSPEAILGSGLSGVDRNGAIASAEERLESALLSGDEARTETALAALIVAIDPYMFGNERRAAYVRYLHATYPRIAQAFGNHAESVRSWVHNGTSRGVFAKALAREVLVELDAAFIAGDEARARELLRRLASLVEPELTTAAGRREFIALVVQSHPGISRAFAANQEAVDRWITAPLATSTTEPS